MLLFVATGLVKVRVTLAELVVGDVAIHLHRSKSFQVLAGMESAVCHHSRGCEYIAMFELFTVGLNGFAWGALNHCAGLDVHNHLMFAVDTGHAAVALNHPFGGFHFGAVRGGHIAL